MSCNSHPPYPSLWTRVSCVCWIIHLFVFRHCFGDGRTRLQTDFSSEKTPSFPSLPVPLCPQEWLNPLPDRSLPHLKIRESILDILKTVRIKDKAIPGATRHVVCDNGVLYQRGREQWRIGWSKVFTFRKSKFLQARLTDVCNSLKMRKNTSVS